MAPNLRVGLARSLNSQGIKSYKHFEIMMTQETFTTPDAVAEMSDCRNTALWIRDEDGNYRKSRSRTLNDPFFPLSLPDKNSLRLTAFHNQAQLRFVAGKPPGVYQTRDGTFLNPELVPLEGPFPAADPPVEFQEGMRQISKLKSVDSRHPSITQIRKRLIDIFCEQRGLKPFDRIPQNPGRILKKPLRHLRFPGDDHGSMFRNDWEFVWTSQPYGYDAAEVLGFARQHDLLVTASPKWSWYCPGSSILIEWRQKTSESVSDFRIN